MSRPLNTDDIQKIHELVELLSPAMSHEISIDDSLGLNKPKRLSLTNLAKLFVSYNNAVNNLDLGSYDITALRGFLAGGKFVVDEDGKITSPTIDALNGRLDNITEKTKNLFNKDAALFGYYIDATGVLTTSASFYASDWIPCDPSTNYYKNTYHLGAYYDENKVFISGFANGINALTTPVNCAFVRYSIAIADINISQFELGSVGTSYTNYLNIPISAIPMLGTSNLSDSAITKNKIKNNVSNELFPWGGLEFSGMVATITGLDSKIVFQSKITQHRIYITSISSYEYTLTNDKWLVLTWDADADVTTEDVGVFSELSTNTIIANGGLTKNQHLILGCAAWKIVSGITEFTARINNHFNDSDISLLKTKIDTGISTIQPLMVKSSLKESAPNFYAKYKEQSEDMAIVLVGDSISTTNYYTTPRLDAKNRPPLMVEKAYVSYIEEQLRWDGQNYYRYDSGIFTEYSPVNPVTLEYDLINWDWSTNNNRPALTRVLSGLNASVSYQVPANVKRCDFIYRTDCKNAINAVVSVSGGNGILQVLDTSGLWVEANGYTYSAKESTTPISTLHGDLMKSMYQKRLKMKVVGTLDSTIITITNNGDGRLTYWGIQTGIREVMLDFILSARGGHSISRLEQFEDWDVDYYKPDLILWQIPIINQGLDVADASFVPNNMGTKTTTVYATEISDKAIAFTGKVYSPELVSFIMLFGSGNHAIDNDNKWVYGYCNDGSNVSVPNYISKTLSMLNTNSITVLDMFSLYFDYMLKKSVSEELPINQSALSASGINGTSLTIDGTHFNTFGAGIAMKMFGSFFLQ